MRDDEGPGPKDGDADGGPWCDHLNRPWDCEDPECSATWAKEVLHLLEVVSTEELAAALCGRLCLDGRGEVAKAIVATGVLGTMKPMKETR